MSDPHFRCPLLRFKRLTFAGVNIVTLAEGDITHPHIGFNWTMNALFLKISPTKRIEDCAGVSRAARLLAGFVTGTGW